MNIELKKLTAQDAEMLQSLSWETFYESFSKDNTEENMRQYMSVAFTLERLTSELNNPHSEFFVAFHGVQPIGYIKLNDGEAQTELRDANALEIERIYVRQAYHGQKVGQMLLDSAINIALQRQKSYIWLGVWEKNQKAISFYQKNGFTQFSQHIFIMGDDHQTDLMLKRHLK